VLVSLCYVSLRWRLEFVALRARSKEFQELDIIVLRHELAILRRTTRRPAITAVDRVLLAVASRRRRTPDGKAALDVAKKRSDGVRARLGTGRRQCGINADRSAGSKWVKIDCGRLCWLRGHATSGTCSCGMWRVEVGCLPYVQVALSFQDVRRHSVGAGPRS
jgi:hypothetical protein